MQYSSNIKKQLTKMVAEKQAIIQTLKRDKVPTYTEVIKGGFRNANNEEDNVSNMSNSTKSTNKNSSTENVTNVSNNDKSLNTNNSYSSQWSKESVLDKIKQLSNELKQEKQERQKERDDFLKEREKHNQIIEGMKQFQELIINMDEDTDEEISIKVRKIARKIKRQTTKEPPTNETKQNNTSHQEELSNQTDRQQEIENELNNVRKSGLQSPPKLKSDFSKHTLYSDITEKR